MIDRAPAPVVQRCPGGCGDECAHHDDTSDTSEHAIRRAADGAPHDRPQTPPVVRRVLASPGQPLDSVTRVQMQERLGRPFDDVRIHTDDRAAVSARAVGARAYTFGRHVVFGRGEFAPASPSGQRLLAHELTHVVQQGHPAGVADPAQARIAGPELDGAEHQAQRAGAESGGAKATPVAASGIQRETLGTKFSHPAGAKSPHKKITAHFDGAQFTVFGDGKQLMQADAQSGRPYTVRPADAKACGGDKDDTYLNNPTYVGIADNGPIPEGTFQFSAGQLATFSTAEQVKMLPGGNYTDPFGVSLHGGDWGAGRVPLTPVSVVAAPKGCGNTKTRSGFFLHGGVMPGSSGCIDVGNNGVDQFVKLLSGYTGKVVVTVKYTAKPPSVGTMGRAVGRFTYPKKKDPSFWDRVKAAAGAED
jgi:hypothetical protein